MTIVANFRDPEVIDIGGKKVTVSTIPSIESLDIYRSLVTFVRDNGAIGITLIPTDLMIRITKYTALELADGSKLPLDTNDNLGGHFSPIEILAIVKKMYDKNYGFFEDGSLRALLLGAESPSDLKS